MKVSLILACAVGAMAFPTMKDGLEPMIRDVLHNAEKRSLMTRQDYLGISRGESNCGTRACPTFDPKGRYRKHMYMQPVADRATQDQFVTVSGEHAYASPAAGDIRGPCPGLNAGERLASKMETFRGDTTADSYGPSREPWVPSS